MKSIVLTGFMGTGKSCVGIVLAKKLSFKFIDTDAMIEKKAGVKISEIFEKQGESSFRDLESEVIRDVSNAEDCVVVTGGGAIIRDENIQNLKKCGIVVCLTATADEIYNRVKDETHRPLLQVPDPVAKIKELLEARKDFYAKADEFIDTSGLTVDEVADKIVSLTGY